MALCSFCAERPAFSKGLCKRCYERKRTTGSVEYKARYKRMTEEEAFFDQVKQEGSHWIWTGPPQGNGYGMFCYKGTHTLAHRWSYTFFIGDIPPYLVLDHECRIRLCVYPWCLDPVTDAVNIARGASVSVLNGKKTHCPKDHPYTPENTYVYKGKRQCVACRAVHNRNRKKKPKFPAVV